ncbi:hypothetical protein GC194_09525 [bacterium]|nr:hypothetical protein [bacterium]
MNDQKAIRLKIYFEKETTIERVVDIDLDTTLEDLHLTILAAFDFNAGEMASFWLCNTKWERQQEIPMIRIVEEGSEIESACMSDVKTVAAINQERPSLIYEYDMLLMWVLRIEFVEITDKIASMAYPVLVHENGKVPNPDEARSKLLEENSTDHIAEDLFREGGGDDDYFYEDFEGEYDDY